MGLLEFEALQGENNAYGVNLSGSLPEGVTLSGSAGTAAVYDEFEVECTAVILADSAVTTSSETNVATLTLKTGHKPAGIYRVRLTLPQSNSKTIQEDVTLVIREVAV